MKTMQTELQDDDVTRFLDAWFAVRQFIQASNFNRFQRAGLSATQFMTLNLLPADGSGMAIGELARRMNLRPATVARTVDSLEARDMIARVRGQSDKRVVLVKITTAGADLQNAASAQFRRQIGSLLAAMLPRDRRGLVCGLEALSVKMTSELAAESPRSIHGPDGAARRARSSPQSAPK